MTDAMLDAITRRRNELRLRGFLPIPLFGKAPALKEWQRIERVTFDMLVMWEMTWPSARDTGCLTKWMPSLDLDILREDAAVACEDLLRDKYEEAGWLLTRIGKAPKRLILFRTDQPFEKLTVNFVATPAEKIELLGSGQQCVVHGIHVDTRKPYRWFGGEPWAIHRDELPYIDKDRARELVEEVAHLLVTRFGYRRIPLVGSTAPNRAVAGGFAAGEARWAELLGDIRAGRSLHDNIVQLAAMLVGAGLNTGAATHLLGGLMETADIPHDARWQARYLDVPRAVDSAAKKYRNSNQR